jgi:hypothetical protein
VTGEQIVLDLGGPPSWSISEDGSGAVGPAGVTIYSSSPGFFLATVPDVSDAIGPGSAVDRSPQEALFTLMLRLAEDRRSALERAEARTAVLVAFGISLRLRVVE